MGAHTYKAGPIERDEDAYCTDMRCMARFNSPIRNRYPCPLTSEDMNTFPDLDWHDCHGSAYDARSADARVERVAPEDVAEETSAPEAPPLLHGPINARRAFGPEGLAWLPVYDSPEFAAREQARSDRSLALRYVEQAKQGWRLPPAHAAFAQQHAPAEFNDIVSGRAVREDAQRRADEHMRGLDHVHLNGAVTP